MTRANRWRRWTLGVLALALVLAVFVDRVFHGRPPGASTPVPIARKPMPPIDSPARPVVNMPRAAASRNGRIEVCGHGEVQLDAGDPTAMFSYIGSVSKDADARWRSALLASDEIRARAVGLLLQAYATRYDGQAVGPAAEQATSQSLDELVQLATASRDPAVYAIAARVCNAYSDSAPSASCQQISLDEWARLDPDNAVPWLLLARSARVKNDSAAEAAAFRRAAEAERSDSYGSSLYAFAEPELPVDATPLERLFLATELIGYEAAWPEPQYQAAMQHCSAAAMQDDAVRQGCDSVARLLTSKPMTLADLSVGISLGERVGWSAGRVAALRQELNALGQSGPPGGDDPWSCRSVLAGNEYIAQVARLGDVGAARAALEASGNSVADAAQKQVDLVERLKSAAQKQAEPAAAQP